LRKQPSLKTGLIGGNHDTTKKAVTRRSEERYRDRSKHRRIVVTLYPAGFIGLRLEKCRHEETPSIRGAYATAVQTRVMRTQAERHFVAQISWAERLGLGSVEDHSPFGERDFAGRWSMLLSPQASSGGKSG
jgi:hypothetical protein